METEQHEHRHEDRRQNRPFGRRTADKHVDGRRQNNKQNQQNRGRRAGRLDDFGAFDCHNQTQVGPVEITDELGDNKRQYDVRTHFGHRLSEQARHVFVALDFAGTFAVDIGRDKECQRQQEDQSSHKRGAEAQQRLGFRLAQQTAFRHGQRGNNQQEDDQANSCGFQGFGFLFGYRLDRFDLPFELTHTWFNDFNCDPGSCHSQDKGRNHQEVPVAGRIDHNALVKQVDSSLCKPDDQYVQ